MKVTVIGSGVYAKAITKILLSSDCYVSMWTEQEDTSTVLVPKEVEVTNSFEEAIRDTELIYVLTGSKFCENIFKSLKPFIKENQIFVLGSKGILDNGHLITEILEQILPNNKYAVISGPTFAVDIAAQEPIGFTIGAKEKTSYELISRSLKKVYLEYSSEVEAVEMAGSLKNAYAIGSGMLLNYGPSTRCLYITRVLREIENIFKNIDSNNSVLTLACIGDLTLTCTSQNSRNLTFGTILALGNKEEKKEYLKNNTVEGYENLKVYYKLFKERNYDSPILNCVYEIVSQDKDVNELIELLIGK